MALRVQDIPIFIRRNRALVVRTGLAAVVLVGSLVIGLKARRQTAQLRTGLERLQNVSRQIDQIRTSFQPATPAENASWKIPAESLGAAIPHDVRITLAQELARRAEEAGLAGIRVAFAPHDSSTPPPRPSFGSTAVTPARYSVVIECDGGFAKLLTFVSSLPSVVGLEQVVGRRTDFGPHYRVILAVYEFANGNQSG